ncbi:MAG: M20 family metallo-hydrolase [Bacteroidota bacterium]|nr:M20 family metallo-hydrolase [Bacteroidota bacterium]
MTGAKHIPAKDIAALGSTAAELLRGLVRIPSFSRQEGRTADYLSDWFSAQGMTVHRQGNNIWMHTRQPDPARPTVMLCSHHDTVRPVASWQRDPFDPGTDAALIYGLGSNDAGAALAAMSVVFTALWERSDLPFNLRLALTAEEEIAGDGGVISILEALPPVALAIVGEPTGMEMAIAEKGLMVLDGTVHGKAGHAARDTGVNAIRLAMQDVAWFHTYVFPRASRLLGPVRMTVTQIQAGTQHNVVPDRCSYVVDIRMTDAYTHEEVLEIVRTHVHADVRPRSTRLRPSAISESHPVVRAAERSGVTRFVSPTMSDQALLPMPSVKLGPGRSERSHTAEEYVTIAELQDGVATYLRLLESYTELIT